MKLFELFDKPSPYQSRRSGDIVDYEATLSDGSILEIEFYKSYQYAGNNSWFLSFSRREAGTHSWTRSTDKTGQGREVDVMSTVVSVVSEFVRQYKPNTLQFTAAKSHDARSMSRANLYSRMIDRLAGQAYDVQKEDGFEGINYTLIKKGYTPEPQDPANAEFTDEDF